jgi:ATP-binding cassette subfamily B protein/subfamily B ATP-binding cassette protein MsbA
MTFLQRMIAITHGHRALLGLAIAGGVLYTGLALVPALLIREVLRVLTRTPPNIGLLWWLGLATVGATALMALGRHMEGALGHIAAYMVLHDLRLRFYAHLLRLSMGFHTRQQSGVLATKLIADVETIELFTAHAAIQLIVTATVPVFLGAVMLWFNWRLALVALAPIPVILLLLTIFRGPVFGAFASYRELLGRLNGLIVDHVQGVGVLKAFGAAGPARREVEARSAELAKASIRVNLLHTSYFAAVEWMATIPLALVLVGGGIMAAQGLVGVPDLVLFLFLTTQLYRPVTELNRQIEGLRNAQVATERVFEVLTTPLEVAERPGVRPPAQRRFDVALDQVTFAYETGRPVLHDVSLQLREGAVLALVGPSGAGKTTVANLIARFWDPQQGAVRLGGVDLRDLPLDYVHGAVGLVLQDVFLFNDTVAANIRLARPDASDQDVEAAARAANAHEFVSELPKGYKTLLGERGVRLSGGQKQRISIARALLKDAPVLILDEATSSVDPEAEHLIQAALARLVSERTVLVIAHRLSTTRQAGEIVVLDRGRVVQRGRHEDLVDAPGLYANLYRAQQMARRWDVAAPLAGAELDAAR